MNKTIQMKADWPRYCYYCGMLTIGLPIVRPLFSLTLSDYFFFSSLFIVLLMNPTRIKLSFSMPTYFIWGIIFFIAGGLYSSLSSRMPLLSLSSLLKYIFLIGVWFWLGTIVLREQSHIKMSVFLWTVSVAISGIGAGIQLVYGDVIPGTTIMNTRMTGFTGHVNDLGDASSIALVPAITLFMYENTKITKKIIMFIIISAITVGLILSSSLGGLVAAIAAFLVWFVASKFSIKPLVFFGLWIIMAITINYFAASHLQASAPLSRTHDLINIFASRFKEPLSSTPELPSQENKYYTISSRLDTYKEAWRTIIKRPLVGVGLGPELGKVQSTGWDVHNYYLLNWYEGGLFSFIGMIMVLCTIAWVGYNNIHNFRSNYERDLAISLLASYCAFLTAALSQPIYFIRFGWISAALIIAFHSAKRGCNKKDDGTLS